MRLFIAVEFDKSIKEYLYEQQNQVREFSEKGNFTKSNNFHLTLIFLGEVKNEQVSILKNILDNAALNQKQFVLCLDKLGQFVRGNRKIIWIGTKKNNELDNIYKNLEDSTINNGFIKEKHELVTHITLGREVALTVPFLELSQKIRIQEKDITVDKISLMESTRIKGELTYIPIYCAHFH